MKNAFKHLLFLTLAVSGPLASLAHADCTLGKNQYGYTTVNTGRTSVGSYTDLDSALSTLKKLREAGVCDKYQTCQLDKNQYGYLTIDNGSTTIGSYTDLDAALATYSKLISANVCDPNSDCKLNKNQYGYLTVAVNGTEFGSYTDLDAALAQLDKLRNSGLCSGSQQTDSSCLIQQNASGYSVFTKNGAVLVGTYGDFRLARIVKQALVRADACR